jgi:hypothetical protein
VFGNAGSCRNGERIDGSRSGKVYPALPLPL